jgi:hypothetical protein
VKRLGQIVYENSLSLALLALFLVSFVGQIATGMVEHNNDLRDHGEAPLALWPYLNSGHFIEATAGTWASEFLQITIFVLLSARLPQKGSPEGLSVDRDHDDDGIPDECDPDAPWPLRKGGLAKWLYSHSLSLVFSLLFLVNFVIQAFGGAQDYSIERMEHGQPEVGTLQYLITPRFWFVTFQNWQSNFLSLAAMVYFLIFLREKGSAASKRLTAPNDADE